MFRKFNMLIRFILKINFFFKLNMSFSGSPRLSRFSFRNNKRPDRSNGDQYYYITDFNQVTDKDCINYDKLNDKIYLDNLKLFNDINKKLRNSIIQVTEKPKPPNRPNNYERLFLWRQRNIKLSVQDQTIAILYLLSKNINIKLPNSYNDNGIEPWEAIVRADHIAKELRENKELIAFHYLEFIKNKNLECLEENELSEESNNNSSTEQNNSEQSNNDEETNNRTNNRTNNGTNNITGLLCNKPEHHNVKDKISHFSNRHCSIYPSLDDNIEIRRNNKFESRERPMSMNFNVNVDNNPIPSNRTSMYLPQENNVMPLCNVRSAVPSAPLLNQRPTSSLPPDYNTY